MSLNLKPLQVIAPQAQRDMIAAVAAGEGISQAQVVRDCLDEALPRRYRRHRDRLRRAEKRN